MSTEHGVVALGAARAFTERVRERIDFLSTKIGVVGTDGRHSYEAAELAALRWALPLMEAECDFIRRLQAEVLPAERAAHPNDHDRRAVVAG